MSISPTSAQTYILCEIASTIYGIASATVRQLEMVEQITPLPNAPPAVEGLVFSRGQVLPALSLRRRFGFAPIPHDLRTRLVVVQIGERTVGLIVDTAREFVHIPQEAIQPPPEALAQQRQDYLEGIARLGERLVLVLRLGELLRAFDLPPSIE